jgi:hypothetical protein
VSAQRCPNCNAELPPELGQHALTPTSGLVMCPSCGETVTLERPETTAATGGEGGEGGGDVEGTRDEAPPLHETIEGVMDEIREKEDA